MQTVVHVTHEAIQKIGGIGAVLQGLLTSRVYLDQVPRNILVGPYWPADESGEQRLGPQGEVLYSSWTASTARRWRRGSARSSRRSTSASSTAGGGSWTRRPASSARRRCC